jgi:hypothetical protein
MFILVIKIPDNRLNVNYYLNNLKYYHIAYISDINDGVLRDT